MSTHNIPISIYKHKKISNLQLWDFFSLGLKNEFETVMVYETSVFKPLKFNCSCAFN